MTRRVVKPQPEIITGDILQPDKWYAANNGDFAGDPERELQCPYGQPGDMLWVKETFNRDWCDHVIYKADGGSAVEAGYSKEPRWKPSIFMPRQYSRITLEITAVRVERLQDITEGGAEHEGAERMHLDDLGQSFMTFKRGFQSLWDSINEQRGYGWDSNPWVWVIFFQRIV